MTGQAFKLVSKYGKTPPGTPEKPERINFIRKLMLSSQWSTGQSVVELAGKWNLSLSAVKSDAAEASRSVREAIGDKDEVVAKVWGMLERARMEALSESSPGARSRALQGTAALMMKLAGIEAPTRTELSGPDGGAIQVSGPTIMVPPESDD